MAADGLETKDQYRDNSRDQTYLVRITTKTVIALLVLWNYPVLIKRSVIQQITVTSRLHRIRPTKMRPTNKRHYRYRRKIILATQQMTYKLLSSWWTCVDCAPPYFIVWQRRDELESWGNIRNIWILSRNFGTNILGESVPISDDQRIQVKF